MGVIHSLTFWMARQILKRNRKLPRADHERLAILVQVLHERSRGSIRLAWVANDVRTTAWRGVGDCTRRR
jgi:hypothetical protein